MLRNRSSTLRLIRQVSAILRMQRIMQTRNLDQETMRSNLQRET